MGEAQVQNPKQEEMLCLVKEGSKILSLNVCSLGIWLVAIRLL
jgi:hypothetical protein